MIERFLNFFYGFLYSFFFSLFFLAINPLFLNKIFLLTDNTFIYSFLLSLVLSKYRTFLVISRRIRRFNFDKRNYTKFFENNFIAGYLFPEKCSYEQIFFLQTRNNYRMLIILMRKPKNRE